MNKIKIISDKNRNSIRIKKSLSKITQNSKLRKSDISIVIGGDGFMLTAIHSPGAIEDFVELVVPELQRRGMFRTEYKGTTQREILNQHD